MKLLYFIEKEHLIKYGRFITGDTYVRLPRGPVPSLTLDIINNPSQYLDAKSMSYLNRNIEIANNSHKTIKSISAPHIDELSESEISAINTIVNELGTKTANELVDLSHLEKTWINTQPLQKIELIDFVSDLPEAQKTELIAFVHKNRETEKELHAILA